MKAGAFFAIIGLPVERRAPMLKLPPPIWALFYLIVAAAISYVAGWPRFPGCRWQGWGFS
jgi:hypothetical protein